MFLGTLLAICCQRAGAAPHPTQADSAKQCAICHYRWVYTFYVEHRGTPLAELQEERVVGSRDMCLSCHDGSVADSRNRICNDPGHQVGKIPSARVRIPDNFPLDDNGALMCATCHTPHALTAPAGDSPEGQVFLRADNTDSAMCRLCHIAAQGGASKGNHPIDISADRIPDAIVAAGGKTGSAMPNQIICETCHTAHGGVNNSFLLLPTEDSQGRSLLCETCHTTAPGTPKPGMKKQYSHPVDIVPDAKIAQFPPRWEGGSRVVRGTSGQIVCRTCHMPHYAPSSDHLLVQDNREDSLCLQCHPAQRRIVGSAHDLRISAPGERPPHVSGTRPGPCSYCHLTHSGSAPRMWARPPRETRAGPDFYCAGCHSPGGSAGGMQIGADSHPVGVSVPRDANTAGLPLFNSRHLQDNNGLLTCMTCHNLHDPAPVYERGRMPRGSFLRSAAAGYDSHCTSCHQQQASVRGTPHDSALFQQSCASGAGPFNRSLCGTCHAVHNAAMSEFLWNAPVGPGTRPGETSSNGDTPAFMTSLCTGCHVSSGCAADKVPAYDAHPGTIAPVVGIPLSAFQIQESPHPLYGVGAQLSLAGSIVCSTCHNPHQWQPDRQEPGPGTPVEGDITTSFLRPDLATGFCVTCHGEETLIKLKYFHQPSGRRTEEKLFSFPLR